jgi:hypothetical protein
MGGVEIFILFLLLVVAIGFGIALYMTGGALIARSDKDAKRGGSSERRPLHKRPTTPTQENVEMVGTRKDDEPDA